MNAVSGWERKNIMGLVSDETSGHHRIAKADYKTQGKTPVVDQSMDFIAGYTDEESSLLDPPYVVFGDHTREIKHLEQPFLPGAQGVRIFKVNKDIDSKFMYYYLVSNKVQNLGYSRHFKLFKQIEVPLPPLAEQQRIADILDTSAEIIQEEERLQHSILPLAINVVERKITSSDGTLGNLIKSMSSGKNVAESPDPNQKNWVLKVSAVTSGTFKPEESKPLPDTYLPPQSHQVRRGDILVSRANTAQLLGASALVENDVESLYLPDKIWRVTPKDRVDPYLLWGILQTKTVRARISQRATGSSGSMKNISQKNFLQVPCATFSESESAKLAALIREAVSVHHQIAHKLSLLRSLHNSLSTRAFAGQL